MAPLPSSDYLSIRREGSNNLFPELGLNPFRQQPQHCQQPVDALNCVSHTGLHSAKDLLLKAR